MFVKREDIQLINRLRKDQAVFGDEDQDWDTAFSYSDTAVHGVLDFYRRGGKKPPIVGYELMDATGRVVCEIEVAWPEVKFGVYVGEKPIVEGWTIVSIGEAIT